jgi:hypothetical protein
MPTHRLLRAMKDPRGGTVATYVNDRFELFVTRTGDEHEDSWAFSTGAVGGPLEVVVTRAGLFVTFQDARSACEYLSHLDFQGRVCFTVVNPLGRPKGMASPVLSIAASPEGDRVILAGYGALRRPKVRAFDLAGRLVAESADLQPDSLRALAFDPTGRLVAVSRELGRSNGAMRALRFDGDLRVVDAAEFRPPQAQIGVGAPTAIAAGRYGSVFVAVGSAPVDIVELEIFSGRTRPRFEIDAPTAAVSIVVDQIVVDRDQLLVRGVGIRRGSNRPHWWHWIVGPRAVTSLETVLPIELVTPESASRRIVAEPHLRMASNPDATLGGGWALALADRHHPAEVAEVADGA